MNIIDAAPQPAAQKARPGSPPDVAAPKLLHLGCGLTAPPEWVNIDASPNVWLARHRVVARILTAVRLIPNDPQRARWPTNILRLNLRKLLPFPDNTFDAVYSSHFLEHLDRQAAVTVLREAWRVLKPGGHCRTLVPDLRVMVNRYLGADSRTGRPFPDDPARQFCDDLHMRVETQPTGLLRRFLHDLRADPHLHKAMYDGPSLCRLMTEAGFVDCAEAPFLRSNIPQLDKVEMADRVLDGAGVAVEGRRPGVLP